MFDLDDCVVKSFFFLDAKRPCQGYEDTWDFIPRRNEDHYKALPWKTCFCLP